MTTPPSHDTGKLFMGQLHPGTKAFALSAFTRMMWLLPICLFLWLAVAWALEDVA